MANPRKRIELHKIDAEEVLLRQVKTLGNSGRVLAPKTWIGRDVYLVLPKRDKDLEFVEYMINQGMMLLDLHDTKKVAADDPMLLDNMFSTSVVLSDLDKTYDISQLLQDKIDNIVKKLDDILEAMGYLGEDEDEG